MITPAQYPSLEKVESLVSKWLDLGDTSATDAIIKAAIDIERERAAKEAGECSGAGLADDLRLVAKLESKRMGAMSSGLIKGVIDRLSALPPPPAEGTVA